MIIHKYLGAISVTALVISATACAPKTIEQPNRVAQKDITASCENLAQDFKSSSLQLIASKALTDTGDLPAYCQITGTITPNIGFEARYPLTKWNEKYFQTGCGGFCGVVTPDRKTHSNAINHALRRGYATVTTDGGHKGEHSGDARWAKDNPVAEEVFAHKTLPLTLKADHELIGALYQSEPKYSYFSGCSNGGRMGAIAAQRYPELFDGIVSGCPILDMSTNAGAFGPWLLQSMSDKKGQRLLTSDFATKLGLLEKNSVAQCDERDGKKDGIISAPLTCSVDLSAIATCGQPDDEDCLTETENTVVQKWYQGPQNSAGKQIFAGMPPGSERYWGHWYLGNGERPGPGTFLADGYATYLGYSDDPADYSALKFNFDTDVDKLREYGQLYDALDPDLSAFKAAGGKMIMWHGLSDPLVIPNQSPEYYENVKKTMGGEKAVSSFYRLFMAPGLGHCWEFPADTPDQMDMLGALENWVEKGIAPGTIAVTQYYPGSDRVKRKGRLKPYPLKAEYGSILP